MKKIILILILALALSLLGCSNKMYTAEYYDNDGALIKTEKIESPDAFSIDPLPDKNIDEYTYSFDHWDMEVNDSSRKITATAVYTVFTENLEKVYSKYTNNQVFNNKVASGSKLNILVVYVSFKDSPSVDKGYINDLFLKDYELDECLKSVSSYFKYNSYGKDLLDFTIEYYDSPMTIEEAWHYVNDEDSYGNFVGNNYLYSIFDELKKNGRIDTKKLDGNRDGYVDSVIFAVDDRNSGDLCIYGGAQSQTSIWEYVPDTNSPVLGSFIKLSAAYINKPVKNGSYDHEGTRILIHEIGHLFGLSDYYDFYLYNDELIDTLGAFDMQSYEAGDWNPFSKFSAGWLSPYVITDDIDEISLKLKCSSEYNSAVLIPSSAGWNGTAFDEYILIDVMAPAGANGFDWNLTLEASERNDGFVNNRNGGVRIYHIDARLLSQDNENRFEHIYDIEDAINNNLRLVNAYANTNGYDPYIESEPESRFYHLCELVPLNGTSMYRICTPTYWSAYRFFCTNDLFAPGETFSMETHKDSFANEGLMNNGSTFDYEVKVNSYDEKTHEAVITVKKIR